MDVTNKAHSNDVLRELNEQRKRAELTDVVLEVEGRSFPCHRAVLASCSPYFRTMFTSGYAEAKQERISIQDVSEVAMATILDYAYTGCLQTEPDQVQAVMSAARFLQVDFVGREAAVYMEDHLDVSNCTDVLMYADMLGDFGLVEASESYAASRFKQVVQQPSFLQLSLPLLQSMLNREDLLTSSEDDIVQAALRWIEFDQEERWQRLPALCRSFRHSFISPNQLLELESKCLSTSSKLVYSDSTTQRLGQKQTEMQIFLRDYDSQRFLPCCDLSTNGIYTIDIPDNLGSFSVTATPDDELYLAGGVSNSRNGQEAIRQRALYQYNHLLNTWEQRCDMIAPRERCGLVYLRGYIYAIGGDDTKGAVERYDPSRDVWTSIPPIPQPLSSELCAVILDDCIYVISKEGCYCFSTKENTWNKIADMRKQPLHPQAVTYHGSIYCVDCDGKEVGPIRTWVEIYNPTIGKWTRSGHRSLTFYKATLMKYGETLYLITVLRRLYPWEMNTSRQSGILVFQFKNETGTWLNVNDKRWLVPRVVDWWSSRRRTGCLTVRMTPLFLGDQCTNEDLWLTSDEEEESQGSDGSDSEDYLSYL
ncbi:kelch repeat and BTB domain-containing protein 8-like [Branchiostoma lanceolatum]|uniref:kelch repeat and BTB domain-containing protein 8-like n=1 Tax=Branchiostoma lanceolatum TaxID=7740 RepID=UPI003451FA22